ncbi:anti-sigma factor [Paenibacillus tritici]|uniref:Anti-sigma factor n=1 Tax=Paenibacillus tritici TaxID=1873425 RepID=A0ABX2DMG0_9BACL|nr:anti-sigma factor [Paenibacillus tritici]NQX45228.1 anti-sigma factor [Paenibacillus tritici]
MSEEFKEKLRQYSEGTLPEEEREELESELAKLEAYQQYLEEQMEQEEQTGGRWTKADPEGGAAPGPKKTKRKAKRREKSIIRRGKWKARITNTFTVFSALLIFTVISSIITTVFYSTGDRGDTYSDVVSSAIAVTRPNTTVRLSSNAHYFFRLELTGNLLRQVGGESIQVGNYTQNLFLGRGNPGEFNWTDERNGSGNIFYYPSAKGTAGRGDNSDQWKRLEKLPEGTVAEAYLSLGHLYTTDELLKQLEPLNLQPVWFGADAGPSTREDDVVVYPLGFPYQPMWHKDDMKKSEVTTTKTGWFSSVSSYSSVSPSVDEYGSGALRDANFIKTLKLLQQHQTLAGRAVHINQLDTSLAYLEQNGVKLYGAVVTGPVKELLKLREASWVSHLQVGEVRLWNWQE